LTFRNLTSHSLWRNPNSSGFTITFIDFKLPKEGSLKLNKLGTKERT
jgi:hypothetical protein